MGTKTAAENQGNKNGKLQQILNGNLSRKINKKLPYEIQKCLWKQDGVADHLDTLKQKLAAF